MIEFSNIARRKMDLDWTDITLALLELRKNFKVLTTTDATIIMASRLADPYQLSWFDSLSVSVGLEANAATLYSEDLNNSQVYENQMTVINPFK
jgi:predicted nucleic acid-binding protein